MSMVSAAGCTGCCQVGTLHALTQTKTLNHMYVCLSGGASSACVPMFPGTAHPCKPPPPSHKPWTQIDPFCYLGGGRMLILQRRG